MILLAVEPSDPVSLLMWIVSGLCLAVITLSGVIWKMAMASLAREVAAAVVAEKCACNLEETSEVLRNVREFLKAGGHR